MKSIQIYDVIEELDKEYFNDLKENHNINPQNVQFWEN